MEDGSYLQDNGRTN